MSAGDQFGPGFVYVASGGSTRYKIGLSLNPTQRARNLGDCEVLHVIRTTNMRWLEQYLHDAFWAQQNGTGEWYDLTDDDLIVLRGIEFANCEADLPHDIQSLYAEPRPKYALTKIDRRIYPIARAAAILSGQHVQDWLSDVANEAAARVLDRKPIDRKPIKRSPPKPKS